MLPRAVRKQQVWAVLLLAFVTCWIMSFTTMSSFRRVAVHLQHRSNKPPLFLSYPDANKTAPSHQQPYFIFHVGPPKSATTTLQYELTAYGDVLQKDRYVYLGQRLENPDDMWDHSHGALLRILKDRYCMRQVNDARVYGYERPECWSRFVKLLHEYRDDNMNYIVSEENFAIKYSDLEGTIGRTSVDWPSLRDVLVEAGFQPIILVGYRRLYDILPSAKQQWDRWTSKSKRLNLWPPEGRRLEPLFPDILKDPRLYDHYRPEPIEGTIQWSFTDHLVEMVLPYFEYRLLNVHDELSIRSTLFCRVLPFAPNSCQKSQLDDFNSVELHRNSEESLFFDAITTAAADRGWVDTGEYSRREVGLTARSYYETTRKGSVEDFPLQCPNITYMKVLLERSLVKEDQILGREISTTMRTQHVRGFQAAIDKHKFCWIDTDETLKEPHWKQFFESLTRESIVQQKESKRGHHRYAHNL